jgi:hypothetical protein
MNTKVNYGRVETAPTVFVTKDRQRLKQYNNDTVYLRDGDEFELELFNPTQSKVLAKISINGDDLGSGIVLRPGERVYLERYLNEAKKFVFETYSVDGSDRNVQRAIADNGDVEVEFFQESNNPPIIWTSNTYTYPNWYGYPNSPTWTIDQPSIFYCQSGSTSKAVGFQANAGCVTNTGPDLNFGNVDMNAGDLEFDSIQASRNVETGRVEKGSHSNQQLEYDGSSFNSWISWRKSWKILPVSQKVVTAKEATIMYCGNCKAKRKKSSHKFCPYCGEEY